MRRGATGTRCAPSCKPLRPVKSQRDLQNRAHHMLAQLPIQAGLRSIQPEFPARIVE
jgi:hypothetical protein